MRAWIRRIFIRPDASERDAFASAMTERNIHGLFPLAFFSLVIELLLLARGALFAASGHSDWFVGAYRMLYAAHSLMMVGALLLCGYYGRNPEGRSARVGRAVTAGAFLSVAWAAAAAVLDVLVKRHITVFVAAQFLVGGLLLTPPLLALELQLSAEALFVLGVICFAPAAARPQGLLVGTAVSALMAYLMSRVLYESALARFRAARVIEARNTELVQLNEQLTELSMTDPLTKLMNRRYFDEIFQREWGNACRNGEALCVAIVDVDDFKLYNDAFGHQEGDQCLCKVAESMRATLRRSNDTLARYGGEEFIILLRGVGFEKDFAVLESVREAVVNLSITHKNPAALPVITVSIGGYEIIPTVKDSMREVLYRADRALYAAKAAGKNQVVLEPVLNTAQRLS